LLLRPDTIFDLQVTAGSNLLSDIQTEVKDGVLYLSNANKYNWVRSFEKRITVEVGLPDLKELYYNGSGNIQTIDTLKTSLFEFNSWEGAGRVALCVQSEDCYFRLHTGTADIHISGKSKDAYFYTTTYSPIHAEQMHAENTSVLHMGINDVFIHANKSVNIHIENSGNVYCSGKPEIKSVHVNGAGDFIEKE